MPDSDPSSKRSSRSSYGYGYGAGGYGYGYGYGGGEAPSRSFRDYFLIIRERIWYILVVFLIVFAATAVYTFSRMRVYTSVATVRLLRQTPDPLPQGRDIIPENIISAEDFNTQVALLRSANIVSKVADRLRDDELRQFMAPYEGGPGGAIAPGEILARNIAISPVRMTLMISVAYTHPDPIVAAKVANHFVEEYVQEDRRARAEEILKQIDELKAAEEDARRKVLESDTRIQDYKERHNLVSLDQRRDIATERLRTVEAQVTAAQTALKELQVRRDQIREFQAAGRPLTDLAFIAGQPTISTLIQQEGAQRINLAQVAERYRAKHPRMIEATGLLDQVTTELAKQVTSAVTKIEADFDASRRSLEDLKAQAEAQTAEVLRVDRIGVDYETLVRESEAAKYAYQLILTRMKEANLASTAESTKARKVDAAVPPSADNPTSPNIPLNLGLGFLGGIGLGLGFAFFIAFIDDRVKSAFDIEAVIGLPLIGIIPQLKRGEMPDRAQVVLNNTDKQVAEAFRTLHSSIKLNDESKSAQLLLVTSTIPSEGKSFVAANLALTFAAHGERTLLVDCDLRKPAVHKEFKVDNSRGLIDHCLGSISLDEAILRNVSDNFDLMCAGGRSKSPTQLLNSKQFEEMLVELRKRYRRIIFDTPPLGAVSDATVILPSMDGSLFVIQFSRTKRKAAQHVARRLMESNVPCFGAVLNGLDIAVSGYYYSQYYDKAYKDYYIISDTDDDETAPTKS